MLIGEVVKRSGLSKDTIRHYESLGLLHSTPRQAGTRRYRDYDDTTLERLSLIAFGKQLQMSLREMVEPMNRALSNTSTTDERRAFALEKVAQIDARIAALQAARAELLGLADDPEKHLADRRMKALGHWIE